MKDLVVVVDALDVCSSVTNEHVTDLVSECTASLCEINHVKHLFY